MFLVSPWYLVNLVGLRQLDAREAANPSLQAPRELVLI